MKNNKLYSILTILLITLFMCSCESRNIQSENQDELYNYQVAPEPFEEMEVIHVSTDGYGFKSEAEIFDKVDLVFIGMPTDTYTECETKYYDLNEENEVGKDDKYFASYTIRNVKVLEVLKGDNALEYVKLAERGTVTQNDDGKSIISGVPSQYKIAKKNVKYLYYANYDEKHGFYMAHMDAGKINIDNLDASSNEKIDHERLSEAKTRFAKSFQKYDRTNELSE